MPPPPPPPNFSQANDISSAQLRQEAIEAGDLQPEEGDEKAKALLVDKGDVDKEREAGGGGGGGGASLDVKNGIKPIFKNPEEGQRAKKNDDDVEECAS